MAQQQPKHWCVINSFSHKSEAQPHRGCYEENEFHPWQTQYSSSADQCKSSNACKKPVKDNIHEVSHYAVLKQI